MITVKDLGYSYDGKKKFSYPDFSCARGNELLITGNSGCGKTTLLHIMGGLLRGFNGEVSIDGISLSDLSDPALDRFRRAHLGIVFQTAHMIDSLTVRQNIIVAALDKKKNQLDMLAGMLGITSLLHRKPASLSQGEKQRVSIVRSLINNPGVLLADEPTSSLDDSNTNAVVSLLKDICRQTNSALVIVTHDQRVKDKIHHTVELI